MNKPEIPQAIKQREQAFKKKVAGQKAEPIGAIPHPSAPVPTVPMPRIIPNPLDSKGSK